MFEYVMVLTSIIVGLGLTHLVQGIAHHAQQPVKGKAISIHLVWVVFMFATVVFWWWWQFKLARVETWSLQLYLFILLYAFILYFLCSLLFPSDDKLTEGFDAYLLLRRKWFFGAQALYLTVDLADSAMKGFDHFLGLGTEYWVVTVLQIGLSIGAMFTRNRPYHWAFAISMLVYQLTWSFRQYSTMG